MDIENIIVGLVVLMVLGVVMISLVIPTAQAGISGSNYVGTVSNEVFTTTGASQEATLTKYVASVVSFDKATYTTTTNQTDIVSNVSSFTYLTTPIYTGFQANLTYCYNNANLDNASIYHQGVRLGNIPRDASGCATYAGEESRLTGTQNITLINLNGTTANLTNVSFKYAYWASEADYAVANGKITPTSAATYKTTYYYATTVSNAITTLLNVIPLLLAVILVLIVIGFWKIAG